MDGDGAGAKQCSGARADVVDGSVGFRSGRDELYGEEAGEKAGGLTAFCGGSGGWGKDLGEDFDGGPERGA